MGLAAYHTGDVEPLPIDVVGGVVRSPFRPDDSEEAILDGWRRVLADRFGAPGVISPSSPAGWYPPLEAHRPDVAAAAQATLACVVRHYVAEAIRLTGLTDVCLAGGVALNCVQNGQLLLDRGLGLTGLHIPPYPHDAGVALGAAQVVTAGDAWREPARADKGAGITASEAHGAALRRGMRAERVQCPATTAADLLRDGQVVGWIQGGAEVGPRALGHRSILALPEQAQTRDRLNRLKGREPWRPLAPSLLEDEVGAVFSEAARSPFMLLSLPMSEDGLRRAPAAAHVDGTARLQTVGQQDDPLFRALLEEVRERSGLGCVVNTIFNARGEPIVNSAEGALDTAAKIRLDAVVINDLCVSIT
jgi:carbamoyltransferase